MNKCTIFTSFDNTKIWYKYSNGKGPCLVFIHGLSGSSSAWQPISDYFTKKGNPVLLMDMRGHGLSEKPESRERYSINFIVKDLKVILEKNKIKDIILIGHCYGGMVVQKFCYSCPQIVHKNILINTNYSFVRNKSRFIANNLFYYYYSFVSLLLYPLHFEKNIVHLDYKQFKGTHDLNPNRLYNDIRVTSFRTYLPLFKEAISLDFTNILQKIRVPTLIIHGKKDIYFPVGIAYKINELIEGSQLKVIDDNHIPVINSPEKIITIISDFIGPLENTDK
ncbi:alpha/beta hydrolase [Candidatus Woesearchaeota archaeon]|nr:alpha/beta hydrolase [Candidatus Woesearchaeota archaeon]